MGFPLRFPPLFSWKTSFPVYDFVKFPAFAFRKPCLTSCTLSHSCTIPPRKEVSAHFQNWLYAQREDAHALRFAWHMHSRQPTAASSSILRATFLHNGHSCVNPILNINRKNGLYVPQKERKKERKRKSRGKYYRLMGGKRKTRTGTKMSSHKFRDDSFLRAPGSNDATWRNLTELQSVSRDCVTGEKKDKSNAYCNFTFNAVNTKFDRNFNWKCVRTFHSNVRYKSCLTL